MEPNVLAHKEVNNVGRRYYKRKCKPRYLSCLRDSARACGRGVDGVIRTIRTDSHNVIATLPSSSTYAQVGRAFSASIGGGIDATTTSSTNTIVIVNPPTSGRTMYLDSIVVGSTLIPLEQELKYQSVIGIRVVRNPNLTNGQTLNIVNLNFGSSVPSSMSATLHQGQVPGLNLYPFQVLQVITPLFLDLHGKIVLPPSSSVAVEIGAVPAGENEIGYAATVLWYELDTP